MQPLASLEDTPELEAQFASCNAKALNCCCCCFCSWVCLESCPCKASWDLQSSFHGRSIFQNAIRHLTGITVLTDTNNRDALVISDHSPPQFSLTDPLQKLGIFFNATHTLAGCPSIPPLSSSILPRLHLYSASNYFWHPTQAIPLPHTIGNRLSSLVTFFPNILISSKQVVTLI